MLFIQLTEMFSCIMLPSYVLRSSYVKNCYSTDSRLFIIGRSEIRSCEGTTQGDLVAMAAYATVAIPMILMIVDITSKIDDLTKAAAYADDVTATGKVNQLKNW